MGEIILDGVDSLVQLFELGSGDADAVLEYLLGVLMFQEVHDHLGSVSCLAKGHDVGPGDFVEGLADSFINLVLEGYQFLFANIQDYLLHCILVLGDHCLGFSGELLDPLGSSLLGIFRGI